MNALFNRAARRCLPVALAAHIALAASGCAPPRPVGAELEEKPEQAAARVFAVAERLEKEKKNGRAFAAYHQLARQFPETPEGKKSVERIRRAQIAARRMPVRASGSGSRTGSS
jgi:hypothetical protein